jgi:hypothetical protein
LDFERLVLKHLQSYRQRTIVVNGLSRSVCIGDHLYEFEVGFDYVVDHFAEFSALGSRLFLSVVDDDIFRSHDVQSTSCYNLLAINNMSVLDIIECQKVGTGKHGISKRNWKFVQDGLSEIFLHQPFDILYADDCGLHAKFNSVPTEDQAQLFSNIIERIDPDVDSVMGDIVYTIRTERSFQLWWDNA